MGVEKKLTKEEKKELDRIIGEITNQAKLVVEDYAKNPSQDSGSVIEIHENSPLLDEDKNKK